MMMNDPSHQANSSSKPAGRSAFTKIDGESVSPSQSDTGELRSSAETKEFGNLGPSLPKIPKRSVEEIFKIARDCTVSTAFSLVREMTTTLLDRIDDVFSLESFKERISNPLQDALFAGRHVRLPKEGTLYVISDLEGKDVYLEHIIEKHNLIERIREGDKIPGQSRRAPVYFASLGDLIDPTGSEAIHALLELGSVEGACKRVIQLAGNHELAPGIQRYSVEHRGGFFNHVVQERTSFASLTELDRKSLDEILEFRRIAFGLDLVDSNLSEDDRKNLQEKIERRQAVFDGEREDPEGAELWEVHQARTALWNLYNYMFAKLPLTITTDSGLFLSHAGPTVRGPLSSIIQGLPTNGDWISNLYSLAYPSEELLTEMQEDLTWSDYSPKCDLFGTNVRKEHEQPGVAFGDTGMKAFLDAVGSKFAIRGHQKIAPAGVDVIASGAWRGKNFLTVDTSLGSYLEIDLSKERQGAVKHRRIISDSDFKLSPP